MRIESETDKETKTVDNNDVESCLVEVDRLLSAFGLQVVGIDDGSSEYTFYIEKKSDD